MIPFWKKTDKGGKKTPPKPAIPHTAQQSIPMQRMFEDGTCRTGWRAPSPRMTTFLKTSGAATARQGTLTE